mmetsp:Transcript_3850/g.8842  ORF Transcript_3850/g.8842 Transcript_3850/m.8842 type:complete len:81 (-) Transcript_3850:43-285(-)
MLTKLEVLPPVPPCEGLVSVSTGNLPGCKFKKSAMFEQARRYPNVAVSECGIPGSPLYPEGLNSIPSVVKQSQSSPQSYQ